MLTSLTRTSAAISAEERMAMFDLWMRCTGYRPPTKADLVPGAELLMVDVDHYLTLHNQGISPKIVCSTLIKLDDEPLRPSRCVPGGEVVLYHCIRNPEWDEQCFVQLDDFCASGYVRGCYANDTRWVIKA